MWKVFEFLRRQPETPLRVEHGIRDTFANGWNCGYPLCCILWYLFLDYGLKVHPAEFQYHLLRHPLADGWTAAWTDTSGGFVACPLHLFLRPVTVTCVGWKLLCDECRFPDWRLPSWLVPYLCKEVPLFGEDYL